MVVISLKKNDNDNSVRRKVLKRKQKDEEYPSRRDPPAPKSVKHNKENLQLRDILLSQLELIQKQNEDIEERDLKLRQLQEENYKLKQKLKVLANSPKLAKIIESQATKEAQFKPPSTPVADKAVGPDLGDDDDDEDLDDEDEEHEAKKVKSQKKPLALESAYYTSVGEEFVEEERQDLTKILAQSEVPAFRKKLLHPLYSMEGTEAIEDEVMEKRHGKLEADERRRKKWDIQRMREQRKIMKLRVRYEASQNSFRNGKKSDFAPYTLLPEVHFDLTSVEVCDLLPVSAFGGQLPELDEGFAMKAKVTRRRH